LIIDRYTASIAAAHQSPIAAILVSDKPIPTTTTTTPTTKATIPPCYPYFSELATPSRVANDKKPPCDIDDIDDICDIPTQTHPATAPPPPSPPIKNPSLNISKGLQNTNELIPLLPQGEGARG